MARSPPARPILDRGGGADHPGRERDRAVRSCSGLGNGASPRLHSRGLIFMPQGAHARPITVREGAMRGRTILLLAAALVTPVTPGAARADLLIAVAGPVTGQYAVFGEQLRRGAELAVKDIDASGGVNGQQLRLTVADDACDPKQAVAVANQLVHQG